MDVTGMDLMAQADRMEDGIPMIDLEGGMHIWTVTAVTKGTTVDLEEEAEATTEAQNLIVGHSAVISIESTRTPMIIAIETAAETTKKAPLGVL